MTIKNWKQPNTGILSSVGPFRALMEKAVTTHGLKEPKAITDNRERVRKWKSWKPLDYSPQLKEAVLEAIANDVDPITDPTVQELATRQAIADRGTANAVDIMIRNETEAVYKSLEPEWLKQLSAKFDEYAAALQEPIKAQPLQASNRLDLIRLESLNPEDAADVIRVRKLIDKLEDIARIWNYFAHGHGIDLDWAPGIGAITYPANQYAHGQILEGTEIISSAIRRGDLFLAAREGAELKLKTFKEAEKWLQTVQKRRNQERQDFVTDRAKSAQQYAQALAQAL